MKHSLDYFTPPHKGPSFLAALAPWVWLAAWFVVFSLMMLGLERLLVLFARSLA